MLILQTYQLMYRSRSLFKQTHLHTKTDLPSTLSSDMATLLHTNIHTRKKHTHMQAQTSTPTGEKFCPKTKNCTQTPGNGNGPNGCGTQINIHQPVARGRRCCSCSDSGSRFGTRVFQYHKHNLRERTCDWYVCTTKGTHTHLYAQHTTPLRYFHILPTTDTHKNLRHVNMSALCATTANYV